MIKTFIRRPVFTTMLVMLLVVFGLGSLPGLGIDLFPEVDFPLVAVIVNFPGASPEELESLVTKPLEDTVSSIAGIKTLSSTVRQGFSQTIIEFELGTDAKIAANDVREKVAGIRAALPEQMDEPIVQRFDITAQAILSYSLASDSRSTGELRKLAKDVVKDELQRLDGVAQVNVYGASDREIRVDLNPGKLETYGLSITQVQSALNNQNVNTPGGSVKQQGTELTIRALGKYTAVSDLAKIVVAYQNDRIIHLGDVATIRDGWAEEDSFATTNGIPSVVIEVQKQSGTNTVNVSDRVQEAMAKLQQQLPPDVMISLVKDSTTYIRSNVEDVVVSLLFGGFLAIVITYLFLGNVRATLIGSLAIPTSIISTFFLMKVMNFTLNQMSLMGLSLAVGILIDDAIVVIENIYRHLEQGESPWQAAQNGTKEISLAVLATTFSLLAVFVPVGNMGEIIGQFFKQFGLTVAFAVAFSLFVALTLTPTLGAYFLKLEQEKNKVLRSFESAFQSISTLYRKILLWALERPKKVIVFAFLSLLVNFLLVPFLGVEFQPTYDSGEFSIELTAPAGTSLERMRELSQPVEQVIMSLPELKDVYLTIGSGHQPLYKANLGVKLLPANERTKSMQTIMDELREKLQTQDQLKVAILSNQRQGKGDSRPVQIGIRGSNLNEIHHYGDELADFIRSIPGTTDVDLSSAQSEPELQIEVNRNRLGELGLDATAVGNAVQTAFMGGTTRNKFSVGKDDYNIRVQLSPEYRLNPENVANLRLSSATGAFVRLGDVAKVSLSSGPTQIDREDRQKQIIVYANTVGISPGEVINQVKTYLPELNLPSGYSYKFVGQAQNMQRSFAEIGKALLMAVVLIYMVLAAEFESFTQPFIIMLSLPFSLIGALLGLLIAGSTINIMSLIGVIMLMGLVTKNAILLVDYTNQKCREGMVIKEALLDAGLHRLRPILMTTMAMIMGMMPVALAWGTGSEIRSSMGVVLIGGLLTSTFLTLVIVPLVYFLLEQGKQYYKNS